MGSAQKNQNENAKLITEDISEKGKGIDEKGSAQNRQYEKGMLFTNGISEEEGKGIDEKGSAQNRQNEKAMPITKELKEMETEQVIQHRKICAEPKKKEEVPQYRKPAQSSKTTKPPSLTNIGANCYLNYALQGLSSCDKFVDEIKSLNDNYKDELAKLSTFHKLILILNGRPFNQMEISTNPIFRNWNKPGQQDCYELLSYVINQVYNEIRKHDEENGKIPKRNLQKWLSVALPMRIIIEYEIRCNCGDVVKVPLQSDLALHVTIPLKGNMNLQDLVDRFFDEDQIEDYECENTDCDGKQAFRHTKLRKPLPRTICVHLQRTYWNGFKMLKINNKIEFSDILKIKSKHCSDSGNSPGNAMGMSNIDNATNMALKISDNTNNPLPDIELQTDNGTGISGHILLENANMEEAQKISDNAIDPITNGESQTDNGTGTSGHILPENANIEEAQKIPDDTNDPIPDVELQTDNGIGTSGHISADNANIEEATILLTNTCTNNVSINTNIISHDIEDETTPGTELLSITSYIPKDNIEHQNTPGTKLLWIDPNIAKDNIEQQNAPGTELSSISSYIPKDNIEQQNAPGIELLWIDSNIPKDNIEQQNAPGTELSSISSYIPKDNIEQQNAPGTELLSINSYIPKDNIEQQNASGTELSSISSYIPKDNIEQQNAPGTELLWIDSNIPKDNIEQQNAPGTELLSIDPNILRGNIEQQTTLETKLSLNNTNGKSGNIGLQLVTETETNKNITRNNVNPPIDIERKVLSENINIFGNDSQQLTGLGTQISPNNMSSGIDDSQGHDNESIIGRETYQENENSSSDNSKLDNVGPSIVSPNKAPCEKCEMPEQFIDNKDLVGTNSSFAAPDTDNTSLEETFEAFILTSVIAHFGSVYGGHYICYKRVNDQWFLTDDSRIAEAQEDEVLSCKNAYILFYEKEE